LAETLDMRACETHSFVGANAHVHQVIGSFLLAQEVGAMQSVARAARFAVRGVVCAHVDRSHATVAAFQHLAGFPALRHVTAHVVLDDAGTWRTKLDTLGQLTRLETLALHIHLDPTQRWNGLEAEEPRAYASAMAAAIDFVAAAAAAEPTILQHVHTCTIDLSAVRDTLYYAYLAPPFHWRLWMALRRLTVAWVRRMPAIKHASLLRFDHHFAPDYSPHHLEPDETLLGEDDPDARKLEQAVVTETLWNVLAPRVCTLRLSYKCFAADQARAGRTWPRLTQLIVRDEHPVAGPQAWCPLLIEQEKSAPAP
jgi:hypothetical protein